MEVVKEKVIRMPSGIYSGYLWKSDQKPSEVKVFERESLGEDITFVTSENPFIVEGQLYNESNKESYSIKYIDGLYWVVMYDLKVLDEDVLSDKAKMREHFYIASFEHAPGRLLFREYWRRNSDRQCLDFETLSPAEFVFVGFKK